MRDLVARQLQLLIDRPDGVTGMDLVLTDPRTIEGTPVHDEDGMFLGELPARVAPDASMLYVDSIQAEGWIVKVETNNDDDDELRRRYALTRAQGARLLANVYTLVGRSPLTAGGGDGPSARERELPAVERLRRHLLEGGCKGATKPQLHPWAQGSAPGDDTNLNDDETFESALEQLRRMGYKVEMYEPPRHPLLDTVPPRWRIVSAPGRPTEPRPEPGTPVAELDLRPTILDRSERLVYVDYEPVLYDALLAAERECHQVLSRHRWWFAWTYFEGADGPSLHGDRPYTEKWLEDPWAENGAGDLERTLRVLLRDRYAELVDEDNERFRRANISRVDGTALRQHARRVVELADRLTVRMMDRPAPELLDIQQFAARLGNIQARSVHRSRDRDPAFPRPIRHVGRSPAWTPQQADQYLAIRRRPGRPSRGSSAQ